VPVSPDGAYLAEACHHVHLNPTRCGLLDAARSLSAFPWSSFMHYLQPPSRRPAWLTTNRLFHACQLGDDAEGDRLWSA
jgi:hypothetical protein